MQVVCKTWKARSCPLYLTLVLPPTPSPASIFFFVFFFFGLLFKKLLRLKINILSSIYPEINFPAGPVMKINNLSRPKVPAPPPSESNGRPLTTSLRRIKLPVIPRLCTKLLLFSGYFERENKTRFHYMHSTV